MSGRYCPTPELKPDSADLIVRGAHDQVNQSLHSRFIIGGRLSGGGDKLCALCGGQGVERSRLARWSTRRAGDFSASGGQRVRRSTCVSIRRRRAPLEQAAGASRSDAPGPQWATFEQKQSEVVAC